MSGKKKFKIKPRKRLPMVILCQLYSLSNALDASDFGHTKVKCPSSHRVTYSEFYKNLRIGLRLPTRISSAEERRAVEKAAGLEEEEEGPEDKGRTEDQLQTEDGGHPQEEEQSEDEGQLQDVEQKKKEQQPAEELPCLDHKDGTSSVKQSPGTIGINVSKACDEFPSLEASVPGVLQNLGMRDDWIKVMQRGSSIPMKKTNSDSELKKSKRAFTSPETNSQN
ncbi:Hypothetical protein FKW44_002777, partial [Caligus rogercresseyi]